MNSPTGDSPTRSAAVIVAAGSSRRMGEVPGGSKLLIPLGGETVLARTLRAPHRSPPAVGSSSGASDVTVYHVPHGADLELSVPTGRQ